MRGAARCICAQEHLSSCGDLLTLCACAGLIGWVPNTDTLHALIREYRDARKIPLNVEHRLMLGMAPDYENLTVIQKVEVFEHALESTSGVQALTPSRKPLLLSGPHWAEIQLIDTWIHPSRDAGSRLALWPLAEEAQGCQGWQ